jgi:TonB-linked SusC/RagA family outer membrane protein
MKKIIFCLSLILMFICSALHAQDKSSVIHGRVKDSEGQALPGVNIVERDKNNRFIAGTSTDLDGNFILKVSNPNATLIVSFIGFKSDTIRLKGEQVKDIVLESESKTIAEVVVKATQKVKLGGMEVNEKDILGAVSVVKMRDVEELGATSVDEAIQGRLTNVDITYSSGDPGTGMRIKMRNVSSLSSNTSPLIVIDDVPQQMTVDPTFNFGTADEQSYGTLLNLDPNDIESIAALVDAATTAQYGAKGGNGVLLVTTKRGKAGKTSVNYSGKVSYSWQPPSIPMLNGDQYTMMIQEELFNPYGVTGIPANTNEVSYNTAWSEYYNYNKNTDWVKEITQVGVKKQHNLTIQGGAQKAKYLYSLSYVDEKGTTLGTALKRLTNRVNFDYQVSDKLKISADISYIKSDNPGTIGDIRSVAFKRMPNMSVYKYDADGNPTGSYFSPQYPFSFDQRYQFKEIYFDYNQVYQPYNLDLETITYNPVAMAKSSSNNKYINTINSQFRLHYSILNSLRFMSSVAMISNNDRNKQFLPQIATGVPWTDTRSNKATNIDKEDFTVNMQGRLIFTPDLGENHSLNVTFEANNEQTKSFYHRLVVCNTPNTYLNEVIIPAIILEENNSNPRYRYLEVKNIISYNYYKQLKFTGTYNRNADSNRGENSRWGTSYAVGFGWDVSQFGPFKKQKTITQLQLRINYGQVGAPTGKKDNQYEKIGTNWRNRNYINLTPIVPLNLQVSDLRPEIKKELGYGFDLELFGNLRLNTNIYSNRRIDQYLNINLPSTVGFDNQNKIGMNAGASATKGYDFTFIADILKSKTIQWNVNLRYSSSVTTWTELQPITYNESDILKNGNYLITQELNKPAGAFYGYKYLGVYKTSADAIIKDANGDPIINYNGYPKRIQMGNTDNYLFTGGDAIYADLNHDGIINGLDITYLGTSDPLFFGSFGTNFTYKAFTITLFFNYRYGNEIINRVGMYTSNMYGLNNQNTSVTRRWRREGDDTDIPRALYNTGYNWLGSDRFVEDGSFLRFKQLSLSYRLPEKWYTKVKLTNCKIYGTLSNIFTFTNYTGQDPESLSAGLYDDARTPPARNFLFGIDLTF